MIDECQTVQPRQRTSRSQQEHCPCGCGQVRFVLREFVSPDGLRWIMAGEQVFVPQIGSVPMNADAGKSSGRGKMVPHPPPISRGENPTGTELFGTDLAERKFPVDMDA